MKLKWDISTPNFESDQLNPSLNVSPWCGHRNFIYDLLNFSEPSAIVELGTHYGCSFFAMCQSIKDNQLVNAKIYAVDTWKGDEQAGYYDESVWQIVNQTKKQFFKDIDSEFLRMYFDDAANQFEDNSFDLIHIDGLHTYEAVSHDFRTWLPKLRANGMMLFHDIASLKGYGSNRFWKEIKLQYGSYLEFDHSWGLGILFPKGDDLYRSLQKQNIADKILIYKYKAQDEYKALEIRDLTQMANERFNSIQEQSKMIAERDDSINAQAILLEERYRAIQEQSKMIAERDDAVTAQAKLLKERYEAIQEQSRMIMERDKAVDAQAKLLENRYDAIQEQSNMIAERDVSISSQAELLEKRYNAILEQGEIINEREKIICSQSQLLEERNKAILDLTQKIDERDEENRKKNTVISDLKEAVKDLSESLSVLKKTSDDQSHLLLERYEAIERQSKMIDERDICIKSQASMLEERYAAIEKQSSMITERDKSICELQTGLDNLNRNYHEVLLFIQSHWYINRKWIAFTKNQGEE